MRRLRRGATPSEIQTHQQEIEQKIKSDKISPKEEIRKRKQKEEYMKEERKGEII